MKNQRKETNQFFAKYKRDAQSRFDAYKQTDSLGLLALKKYSTVMTSFDEPLKLKDFYNFVAIDNNFNDWHSLKQHVTRKLNKLYKLYKEWEIKQKSVRENNEYQDGVRNIFDAFDRVRAFIKEVDLENLNLNVTSLSHPLGGFFAWLKVSDSSFKNSSFIGCGLGATCFENVNLESCIFSYIPRQYAIKSSDYSASHRSADFDSGKFFDCNFKNVIMYEVYARGCTFMNCDFSNASLSRSNFSDALIINCNFENADMQDMKSISINKSNLCGANFFGTKNNKLNDVKINHKTVFGDGTKIYSGTDISKIAKGISSWSREVIQWQCINNHTWHESAFDFLQRSYCRKCRNTID